MEEKKRNKRRIKEKNEDGEQKILLCIVFPSIYFICGIALHCKAEAQ